MTSCCVAIISVAVFMALVSGGVSVRRFVTTVSPAMSLSVCLASISVIPRCVMLSMQVVIACSCSAHDMSLLHISMRYADGEIGYAM